MSRWSSRRASGWREAGMRCTAHYSRNVSGSDWLRRLAQNQMGRAVSYWFRNAAKVRWELPVGRTFRPPFPNASCDVRTDFEGPRMSKRLLYQFLFVSFLSAMVWAQDTAYPPKGSQIPGPTTNAEFSKWLADIQHWRMEQRIRIGYSGSEYDRAELKWTQSSFVQPQMMIHDRFFHDAVASEYTVDRYLDDLQHRYGGIDSVLIWQSYPNIGIDNRNQYDLLRDMPGGVAGVRRMIADFHRRGVRVLFPVMLWDQGPRDEGVPNWTATARLLAEVGADGVNGDT